MQQSVIFFAIVLPTMLSQFAAGELFMKPRSTESKVGETSYFNCSTSLEDRAIFWFHGNKYVYTTLGILDPYRERFEIDRNASNTSYNLVIHSVQPSDAGEYICIDDDGFGTRHTAELVVLENDPDCQSNMQPDGVIGQNIFNIPPDEIQLTCNVTYHGNIPPQLEWKKVGDMNRSITDSVSSNVTSNNRLVYTLKLKGDISLDKSSYVCQTTRSTQNQYKCNSEIIQVLYFVGGNMIEQKVFRGDQITCSTTGNTFPCINQWFHNNNTFDETITTHLLGEYMCLVKCRVRGTDYNFAAQKAVVAEAVTSKPTTKSGTIAASIVIPVVIIILVVLIAVYIVRRNKRKGEQKLQRLMSTLNTAEAQTEGLSTEDSVHSRNQGQRSCVAEEEIELGLLHKIKKESKINEAGIRGVSILCGKLFIVREKTARIEVYDCSDFNLGREFLNLKELVDAGDICSCKKNNRLYIVDKKISSVPREVMSIDIEGTLSLNWFTKDNAEGYLSATTEGNVILTVHNFKPNMLQEYSPDGNCLREIKLSECINTAHGVKVGIDQYIVCHGRHSDRFHRVCLVDEKGKVKQSFGQEIGSGVNQLNTPYYLSVANNGCVMVTDLNNNRVLLLDTNLEFKANIKPKYNQRFKCPRRIYLDGTLLVVVITKGHAEKKRFVEKGDSREKNFVIESSSPENDDLLRKILKCKKKEFDPFQRIEKDCRILVFDMQPILQKYNCFD